MPKLVAVFTYLMNIILHACLYSIGQQNREGGQAAIVCSKYCRFRYELQCLDLIQSANLHLHAILIITRMLVAPEIIW